MLLANALMEQDCFDCAKHSHSSILMSFSWFRNLYHVPGSWFHANNRLKQERVAAKRTKGTPT